MGHPGDDSTPFSELDQINTENVDRPQLAWSFSVGVDRGQEAALLIVNNTMYVMRPDPNNLFALDAPTGEFKWIFQPPPATAAQGVACCDVVVPHDPRHRRRRRPGRTAARPHGKRIFIAGLLRNTPANMMTWLRDPQAVVPGNAMPDMGLSERQARDISAFLYTLE